MAGDPEAGDVIPGTGGFRKLRWADPARGKGKRGGLRVMVGYLLRDAQIWLMTLYNKEEMPDLNAAEKRALEYGSRGGTCPAICSPRTQKEVSDGYHPEATEEHEEAQPIHRAHVRCRCHA